MSMINSMALPKLVCVHTCNINRYVLYMGTFPLQEQTAAQVILINNCATAFVVSQKSSGWPC